MTDFLKGASWGAWFVLAAITAAGSALVGLFDLV
jgi:hypothetical protein